MSPVLKPPSLCSFHWRKMASLDWGWGCLERHRGAGGDGLRGEQGRTELPLGLGSRCQIPPDPHPRGRSWAFLLVAPALAFLFPAHMILPPPPTPRPCLLESCRWPWASWAWGQFCPSACVPLGHLTPQGPASLPAGYLMSQAFTLMDMIPSQKEALSVEK